MTAAARPRLSREFIAKHQRNRIFDATARCVVEKGYRNTTVAHIVSGAGIARNTFYDNFSSKEDAARGLIASVGSALDVDLLHGSEFVLALDIAARLKLGDAIGASALVADAEQLLDKPVDVEPLEAEGTENDPDLAQLPPGRHGLPRDFVAKNQRTRLLAGTARAINEKGCEGATIADITRLAAVSRRTFYEHFTDKQQALEALVEHSRTSLFRGGGLGCLWVEILAASFCGGEVRSEAKRRSALAVVGILGAQLNQAVAA